MREERNLKALFLCVCKIVKNYLRRNEKFLMILSLSYNNFFYSMVLQDHYQLADLQHLKLPVLHGEVQSAWQLSSGLCLLLSHLVSLA